jgi:hypothetical protein
LHPPAVLREAEEEAEEEEECGGREWRCGSD